MPRNRSPRHRSPTEYPYPNDDQTVSALNVKRRDLCDEPSVSKTIDRFLSGSHTLTRARHLGAVSGAPGGAGPSALGAGQFPETGPGEKRLVARIAGGHQRNANGLGLTWLVALLAMPLGASVWGGSGLDLAGRGVSAAGS